MYDFSSYQSAYLVQDSFVQIMFSFIFLIINKLSRQLLFYISGAKYENLIS